MTELIQKLSSTANMIKLDNGNLAIRCHWTDVVERDGEELILRMGDYPTLLTRKWINKGIKMLGFCIEAGVFQKDYEQYIEYDGIVVSFIENMRIPVRSWRCKGY